MPLSARLIESQSPLPPLPVEFDCVDTESCSSGSSEDLSLSTSTSRTLVEEHKDHKLDLDSTFDVLRCENINIAQDAPSCTFTIQSNGASELSQTFSSPTGFPTTYTIQKAGSNFMGIGSASSPAFEEEVDVLIAPRSELVILVEITVEEHTGRYGVEEAPTPAPSPRQHRRRIREESLGVDSEESGVGATDSGSAEQSDDEVYAARRPRRTSMPSHYYGSRAWRSKRSGGYFTGVVIVTD